MWWRLTKAIIVSWLVGVVCGAGMVIAVQNREPAPPAANASVQTAPPTTGVATAPAASTQ
jgi:hypothetical protein